MEATRFQPWASLPQSVDSMVLKWSTVEISGDIQPLIGNIKNNPKLRPQYLWAPNEIAAVVKEHLIIIDGSGKLLTKTPLTNAPLVRGVSMMFDTNAVEPLAATTAPVVLGLETTETENSKDSLIFAYMAGYLPNRDSAVIIRRLSVNVGAYAPNLFGGVTPVLGRSDGGQAIVYATVNMSKPTISAGGPITPFFRGIAQFNTGTIFTIFPLPDVKDRQDDRITLGPEVGLFPPSVVSAGGTLRMMPSVFPSEGIAENISNPVTTSTFADLPYLMSFNVNTPTISEGFASVDLLGLMDDSHHRSLIRPYYMRLNDAGAGGVDNLYILMAEGYRGTDSSRGVARLHLYRADGQPISIPDDANIPSYIGEKNHYWSVAAGNLDGIPANELLPYYPNNPGNEIIVSQSSKEFAYPGSKISVLRWQSGARVEKITKPGTYLFPFDTICTQQMNGWIAAVADIDGAADGKHEIFVADRSKLSILQMRDYQDPRLRLGRPFDTLRVFSFGDEIITGAAVVDLEGDGGLDIIVTTQERSYCFGNLPLGSLAVEIPKIQQTPPQEYCPGDSVTVRWQNALKGQDKVHILFRRYLNDTTPLTTTDTLRRNYLNSADTMEFRFYADTSLFGREGRIIVQGANSRDIRDSSAYIRFPRPKIVITGPPSDSAVHPGYTVALRGAASCLDSLWMEYYNGAVWTRLDSMSGGGATFSFPAVLPCLPIFRTDSTDLDTAISLRIIGRDTALNYRDTSIAYSIKYTPAPLAATISPPPLVACPARDIAWDIASVPISLLCDTVIVAVSIDTGRSFRIVDRVPSAVVPYEWDPPANLRDSMAILRLTCAGGCVRSDTLIRNIKTPYISIIAPNPFSPPTEIAQVIYSVPKQTAVTIRVYDQSNRLVREIISGETRLPGIAYCDHWDGTSEFGIVANGTYYLSVEPAGIEREVYPVFVKKQ
ncbi:hypothetical protein MASR2M18_07610 [Ignavibacteria bacterium]